MGFALKVYALIYIQNKIHIEINMTIIIKFLFSSIIKILLKIMILLYYTNKSKLRILI